MRKYLKTAVAPVLIAFGALAAGAAPASAQSSTTYASGNMWGTTPAGVAVNGALESSQAHAQNSAVAGAVNAAKKGILLGTGLGGLSIYSIGTQTVVSNTIVGSNNVINQNTAQNAQNSGDVSNNGTIQLNRNGNNN